MNENAAWIDELSGDLADRVPGLTESMREDMTRNFKALLQSTLRRLDLVTREEFEIQQALLTRLREQLAGLERAVADLEHTLA
ncbi:MAG TPA: accessory factor UbiK family protein [Candidatus Acidoferrales bacterium]|nr:accessory factor UbiK family protein [Candidatus Acidoferrales bacterium]